MLNVRSTLPRFLCILCSAFSVFGFGCAPAATVHVIPLSLQKVNINRPLIVTFSPSRCYYWINDQRELCIAMTGKIGEGFLSAPMFAGLQGTARHQFDLSLVLPGLPAGTARAYRVDRRTVRCRTRDGGAHTRFGSLQGVVSVWDYSRKTMNGRFRIKASQQSFMVLTGWGKDHEVLCLGEFTAKYNRTAGQAILARTEQEALKRPPR